MNFETFLTQAWRDHAANPVAVAERLPGAIDLLESSDQVPALAQLIVHVFGEHLGQWEDGVELLEEIQGQECTQDTPEATLTLRRSIATLQVAADQLESVEDFSLSDQVRIFASAASALGSQGYFDRSSRFFRIALSKIGGHLKPTDPAFRVMASSANSLACCLEEKRERTAEETDMMITAARAARTYWEVAGTWLEVERAEYRMAMSYLVADQPDFALAHAQACKEICESHRAAPEELFWAYEVVARAESALSNRNGYDEAMAKMNHLFEKAGHGQASWAKSLQELKDLATNSA